MTDKDKKIHSKQDKKDNDLWENMMKDVCPLENKDEVDFQEKQIKTDKKPVAIKNNTNTYTPPTPQSNEVDRRTYMRLKRGQMPINGQIDLHGMTQNQAYDALLSFIPRAYSEGKRCVLVITGKGSNRSASASLLEQNTGVLKQKTPEWLSSAPLNQYVLKTHTARPNHGGEGALYVLLRRIRNY